MLCCHKHAAAHASKECKLAAVHCCCFCCVLHCLWIRACVYVCCLCSCTCHLAYCRHSVNSAMPRCSVQVLSTCKESDRKSYCRSLAGKQLGTTLPQTSSDYSSLTSLMLLDLSNNEFTGPLPPIGSLTSLQTLELEGNSFSGSLPQLAGFTSLTVINFQENQLTGKLHIGRPDPVSLLPCCSMQAA